MEEERAAAGLQKKLLLEEERASAGLQKKILFYTSNGIRVRSKSALIIAETLSKLGIPFRYEFPLKVGKFLFHPDFYCLNVKTRKILIWEHFGMMDNSDYAEHSIEKQELYTKNGFIPGKNLIFTMESRKHPLYSRTVEKTAREIFA